jgi:FkbM family methyltransferase
MEENMDRQLIFDIGLHNGDDTRYYLAKGFKVVSLEANTVLSQKVAADLADHIASGQLTIIEKALAPTSEGMVSFFVNPVKDDWSSTTRSAAEKGLHEAVEISVPAITLQDIIAQHGTPYFIKCDIEGGDALFVRQLHQTTSRPAFVSIESMANNDLAYLYACGYDSFQLVNQQFISWTKAPSPPREGLYVDAHFSAHMSGLFGRDLDPNEWISFDEAAERFTMWTRLRERDPKLAPGWMDFHATTRATLDAG